MQEEWWKSQFFYPYWNNRSKNSYKKMLKLLSERNVITKWIKHLNPIVSLNTKVEQTGIMFFTLFWVIGSAQLYLWSIAKISTSQSFWFYDHCTLLKTVDDSRKFLHMWLYQLQKLKQNLRNIFNPLKKQFNEKTNILKIFFCKSL